MNKNNFKYFFYNHIRINFYPTDKNFCICYCLSHISCSLSTFFFFFLFSLSFFYPSHSFVGRISGLIIYSVKTLKLVSWIVVKLIIFAIELYMDHMAEDWCKIVFPTSNLCQVNMLVVNLKWKQNNANGSTHYCLKEKELVIMRVRTFSHLWLEKDPSRFSASNMRWWEEFI